jgi:hypothetical protein
LVARFVRIEEVRGSIPLSSTTPQDHSSRDAVAQPAADLFPPEPDFVERSDGLFSDCEAASVL